MESTLGEVPMPDFIYPFFGMMLCIGPMPALGWLKLDTIHSISLFDKSVQHRNKELIGMLGLGYS